MSVESESESGDPGHPGPGQHRRTIGACYLLRQGTETVPGYSHAHGTPGLHYTCVRVQAAPSGSMMVHVAWTADDPLNCFGVLFD